MGINIGGVPGKTRGAWKTATPIGLKPEWRMTWAQFQIPPAGAASSDVFFGNVNPIEMGMIAQTAAGMGGVLIE